jgi:hypothetical protein
MREDIDKFSDWLCSRTPGLTNTNGILGIINSDAAYDTWHPLELRTIIEAWEEYSKLQAAELTSELDEAINEAMERLP